MRKKSTADVRTANVPQVGLFFVLGGRPFIDRLPWTEVASVAGFRTFAFGHPEFWERLQEGGTVPNDMPYEDCPRGRVNYEEASGRLTLFGDRCIIKDKRLVKKIMNELSLPKDTLVLPDSHYRCSKCLGKKSSRKQEKEDWDF